ncbi:MAG: hypothetical protein ACK4E5_09295 [Erythrobacter cryptus]
MAKQREKTLGHGITERTVVVTSYDTPEEMLEFLKHWGTDPLCRLRHNIEAARKAFRAWRKENPEAETGYETIPSLWECISKWGNAMEHHLKEGNAEWAASLAFEIGEMLMLLRIKHQWEADALRGRKVVKCAASTRKADDAVRKTIVEAILAERGKGKRDAFRTAARGYPTLGSEGTFRRAFYKNPSKTRV